MTIIIREWSSWYRSWETKHFGRISGNVWSEADAIHYIHVEKFQDDKKVVVDNCCLLWPFSGLFLTASQLEALWGRRRSTKRRRARSKKQTQMMREKWEDAEAECGTVSRLWPAFHTVSFLLRARNYGHTISAWDITFHIPPVLWCMSYQVTFFFLTDEKPKLLSKTEFKYAFLSWIYILLKIRNYCNRTDMIPISVIEW